MTEEEAKTKWCPMERYHSKSSPTNTEQYNHMSRCIASGCMMWTEYQCSTENTNYEQINVWMEGKCGLTK